MRYGEPDGEDAMTELSLALLGPPVVRRDGTPVTFDTRKAIALLALLAVTGREHSREQLADLLWPDADSAKGRASLRRTLSVTAAATGTALTITRAAVTLEPAAVQVDVREFSALIARPDTASLEREAARRFASVDVGDAPRPEIWTLVEW
jgi:DNA-binding SARP family transcriptional activator